MRQDSVAALTVSVRSFCEARDRDQLHSPEDLAIALATKSAELLANFRFLTAEQVAQRPSSLFLDRSGKVASAACRFRDEDFHLVVDGFYEGLMLAASKGSWWLLPCDKGGWAAHVRECGRGMKLNILHIGVWRDRGERQNEGFAGGRSRETRTVGARCGRGENRWQGDTRFGYGVGRAMGVDLGGRLGIWKILRPPFSQAPKDLEIASSGRRRTAHSHTMATRQPAARSSARLRASRATLPSSFRRQKSVLEAGTAAKEHPQ